MAYIAGQTISHYKITIKLSQNMNEVKVSAD